MKENIVLDKSFAFALRIVALYQFLSEEKKEYILSKFLLNSGTLIGARVESSQNAIDRNSFIYEMNTALVRARETSYWLKLLHAGHYLSQDDFDSYMSDTNELIGLLTKITKTSKGIS
jgi:four helix bundle protein